MAHSPFIYAEAHTSYDVARLQLMVYILLAYKVMFSNRSNNLIATLDPHTYIHTYTQTHTHTHTYILNVFCSFNYYFSLHFIPGFML